MLFSSHKSLEDVLLEQVLGSGATIKSLHEQLEREEPGLTLRAVYKAVGKLIKGGVLLKVGKMVLVNEEWARELGERFLASRTSALLQGERAAYTFVSIEHLDAFWKTAAFQLEKINGDGQTFFYNPHNFWAYVPERKESEDKYYRHFEKQGQHGFFTVGGNSVADIEFKRAYQNEYFQIDARLLQAFKRTDHITIVGDFIIHVRLSKTIAAHIDELYASDRTISELQGDLVQLYHSHMATRFILENNPSKAKRLKKILSTNFYFGHPT